VLSLREEGRVRTGGKKKKDEGGGEGERKGGRKKEKGEKGRTVRGDGGNWIPRHKRLATFQGGWLAKEEKKGWGKVRKGGSKRRL